ncbi:MAG: histidinol-phosphate transaminase [Acidimicrobiia bacterium]|nr:histidinol-phosphate transaminase [Acidimicrobiia bacterium]MDH5236889.1 histidinol-phosphate transaminase [Acidimicrobiia bacterium]
MTRTPPAVRDDVGLMAGYHSAQVDVDVRLNTNEAPLPPPQALSDDLADLVSSLPWHRYPDREAAELRQAIASLHGVHADQVFAANGSNEVLYTALHAYGGAGRRALTFEPTYALHGHLARLSGTGTLELDRNADFAIDPDIAVTAVDRERPDIVFLCSPNNPTGVVDPPELIQQMLVAVEDYGGLLVVDEAYGQFADRSAIELLGPERNLLVTRTFSKTWAMAALRLGYVLGPADLIAQLHKVALPYHLDVFTQVAGCRALGYVAEMEQRVADLVAERRRLAAALAEMPVDTWPSQANFILFRPRAVPGAVVWQRLVDQSVLVRDCSSWPRLEGCLRVTVGTPEEGDRFLSALAHALDHEPRNGKGP